MVPLFRYVRSRVFSELGDFDGLPGCSSALPEPRARRSTLFNPSAAP
jgi:hypothetical protein